MSGNPHITGSESTLHPTEASDILLIVGLTLRECKACTDAEPDTPLYHIPFDIEDLGLVQEAVTSMLSAMRPKKPAKWGVSPNAYCAIDSSWRKPSETLGRCSWKRTRADSALMRSGKPPAVLANDGFPDKVKRWAEKPDATVDYQYNTPTSWGVEMLQVWDPIHASINAATNAMCERKGGNHQGIMGLSHGDGRRHQPGVISNLGYHPANLLCMHYKPGNTSQ
ncbi:hypothetical protein B0H13DRAFT_1863685 [Mycena leptocephala]|nr:hypothetical protein B0H13DRAFT_1863685 [Mycena leptocephala]